MHNFLYFSAAAVVVTVVLGIFDKERRRMWLSIVATIVAALVAVILVAWLIFETKVF
jgi:Na+/citrate or Na+/malate symporter